MARNGERYRRLPGRRRGFIFGSSVWMGSDHLLLVKSARFREEYKRFHLRDIQAIVTANAPRFHISTRAGAIGALWLFLLLVSYGEEASSRLNLTPFAWAVGGLLALAWIGVSAAGSCRCRIYTAVSAEDLPSVYRRWTARRFLEIVGPYVAQAQGVIEGNWAEAMETRAVGPPALIRPTMGAMEAAAAPLPVSRRARTPVAIAFVASLFVGGLLELATLGLGQRTARWLLLGTVLVQVVGAAAVLVESYVGGLRPALRNLAIATLAAIGVWYYAAHIIATMAVAMEGAAQKNPFAGSMQPLALTNYGWSRGIIGGVTAVLGVIGVALLLGDHPPREGIVAPATSQP